jgi:hypothetical protein
VINEQINNLINFLQPAQNRAGAVILFAVISMGAMWIIGRGRR